MAINYLPNINALYPVPHPLLSGEGDCKGIGFMKLIYGTPPLDKFGEEGC